MSEKAQAMAEQALRVALAVGALALASQLARQPAPLAPRPGTVQEW